MSSPFPPGPFLTFEFDLTDLPGEIDPLGGKRPRFFLRRDFAVEAGFLTLLPETAQPAPKFFLCGGLFPADSTKQVAAHPFVSDGKSVIYPDPTGLFCELEWRIAKALPKSCRHSLYPSHRLAIRDHISVPPCVVVHSAETGVAEICPIKPAIRWVRAANGYSAPVKRP